MKTRKPIPDDFRKCRTVAQKIGWYERAARLHSTMGQFGLASSCRDSAERLKSTLGNVEK